MVLFPFMTLEYPLIMEFGSSCFRNNVIVSLKKFNKIIKFVRYKKGKALKKGGGTDRT